MDENIDIERMAVDPAIEKIPASEIGGVKGE